MEATPLESGDSRHQPEFVDVEMARNNAPRRERPSEEVTENEEATNSQECRHRKCFVVLIAAVVVFLAPVIFVSAMMAEHGENWKPVFVGLFSSWIMLLSIGLYVDLSPLKESPFIKRCLWHLGCCILMLYIIVSTIKPTAETLPQWIPIIIDCGFGVSIGIQNIPPNARQQLWRQLNELVGCFCGGVQVRFGHSSPHQVLNTNDER